MKSLILSILTVLSVSSLAQTNISDPQITALASEVRHFSEEDLGELESAQCQNEGLELKCRFEFNIAHNYCWYGYYIVNATYFTDHHGNLVLDPSVDIQWRD